MGEAPSSPSPEGSAAVGRAPTPRATRPLRRMVDRLQSVDGVVAKLEGALAVLATFGMVTLVALPMVIRALPTGSWARGLFGDYSWMAQGARFLLTWATFAGASLATRARAHIVVDLVTKLVPGRARAALNVVAALLASLLCLILAGVATYVVWANWSQASVLRGVDKGKAHAIIPVALAVMAARFALVALEDVDGALSGDLAYMRRAEREAQEAHGMVLPEEPGAAASADTAAPAGAAPNREQEARP